MAEEEFEPYTTLPSIAELIDLLRPRKRNDGQTGKLYRLLIIPALIVLEVLVLWTLLKWGSIPAKRLAVAWAMPVLLVLQIAYIIQSIWYLWSNATRPSLLYAQRIESEMARENVLLSRLALVPAEQLLLLGERIEMDTGWREKTAALQLTIFGVSVSICGVFAKDTLENLGLKQLIFPIAFASGLIAGAWILLEMLPLFRRLAYTLKRAAEKFSREADQ